MAQCCQVGSHGPQLVANRCRPLAVGARVAYLWCADGLLASRLAVAVGRALGDAATSRNWATMVKLHALACGAD